MQIFHHLVQLHARASVNSQIASANQGGGGQAGNVGIGFAIPVDTVKDFVANPTSTQPTTPAPSEDPGLALPVQ